MSINMFCNSQTCLTILVSCSCPAFSLTVTLIFYSFNYRPFNVKFIVVYPDSASSCVSLQDTDLTCFRFLR